MNGIIRKLIPVGELPDRLRAEFDPSGVVEIVGPSAKQGQPSDFLEKFEEYRQAHQPRYETAEDVVDVVRRIRDGEDL